MEWRLLCVYSQICQYSAVGGRLDRWNLAEGWLVGRSGVCARASEVEPPVGASPTHGGDDMQIRPVTRIFDGAGGAGPRLLERHRLVAEHLNQAAATLLQQLQPRREALEVLAAREDAKGGSGVEAAVGL